MIDLVIPMPEGALHKDTNGFAHELRIAAAVKWYELRIASQGRAAEIAGVSRAEFLEALGRFDGRPFQYDAGELIAECRRG